MEDRKEGINLCSLEARNYYDMSIFHLSFQSEKVENSPFFFLHIFLHVFLHDSDFSSLHLYPNKGVIELGMAIQRHFEEYMIIPNKA